MESRPGGHCETTPRRAPTSSGEEEIGTLRGFTGSVYQARSVVDRVLPVLPGEIGDGLLGHVPNAPRPVRGDPVPDLLIVLHDRVVAVAADQVVRRAVVAAVEVVV